MPESSAVYVTSAQSVWLAHHTFAAGSSRGCQHKARLVTPDSADVYLNSAQSACLARYTYAGGSNRCRQHRARLVSLVQQLSTKPVDTLSVFLMLYALQTQADVVSTERDWLRLVQQMSPKPVDTLSAGGYGFLLGSLTCHKLSASISLLTA